MTFVKTFEQFKTVEVTEAKDTPNIKKIEPKPGETARWSIVLKSGDEQTISNANPTQSLLNYLVLNGEFKTWYTTTKIEGIPVTHLLGVVYSGVSNKTNLVGKEVAKAEIAFIPYSKQATSGLDSKKASPTSTYAEVMYDLSKSPARATASLENGSKLMVWNSEDLPKIKLGTPKIALNKNGSYKLFDDVTPSTMVDSGTIIEPAATPVAATATAGTSGTAGSAGTSGTAATGATGITGIKRTSTFDQKIQDLQKKIIAKGGPAADSLNAKGGAVGKYGSGTAKAIGILAGTNKEENEITADLSTKIDAALKDVTPEMIAKVQTPAKPAAGAPAAKPAAATATATALKVKTAKGDLDFS
jgi:hypothetical protein